MRSIHLTVFSESFFELLSGQDIVDKKKIVAAFVKTTN